MINALLFNTTPDVETHFNIIDKRNIFRILIYRQISLT